MNTPPAIFSQIMDFMPLHEFRKCGRRHHGEFKVKSFSCFDQFLCLAFAQLTYRGSFRDVESCLRPMQSRLDHKGFRGRVSRNTLAHANETRDWRMCADFAQVLIAQARSLYAGEGLGFELGNSFYAFTSATIALCLSLFPWAVFRRTKGAIKLHPLLDLRGSIPSFIKITDGETHNMRALDDLIPEPGGFHILVRANIAYGRLFALHQNQAFFVIRAKSYLQRSRLFSRPTDKAMDLRCDQTVIRSGFYTQRA